MRNPGRTWSYAMSLVEVKVPDIGDCKDVEVIELLVKPGDTIAVDQSLITVESDKASMEIPSSTAGVVKELKVKIGDKGSEGSVVAIVEGAGGGPASPPPPAAASAPPQPPPSSAPPGGGGAPALSLVPAGERAHPHPVPA